MTARLQHRSGAQGGGLLPPPEHTGVTPAPPLGALSPSKAPLRREQGVPGSPGLASPAHEAPTHEARLEAAGGRQGARSSLERVLSS